MACKERLKPGGCQLHNLQCGYPKCDIEEDNGSSDRIVSIARKAADKAFPVSSITFMETFARMIADDCAKIAEIPQLNDEESYYGKLFARAIRERYDIK